MSQIGESLRSLPEGTWCVTNAILTRGSRVRQGWQDGDRYYETFHYPGALNFSQIIEVSKPEWAASLSVSQQHSREP